MHIHHIALMVNDLEASIKFYETITELTISRWFIAGPGEIAFMTNGVNETEKNLFICRRGKPLRKLESHSALKQALWMKSINSYIHSIGQLLLQGIGEGIQPLISFYNGANDKVAVKQLRRWT